MRFILTLLPLPLLAQETLPEIIITASRQEEEASKTAYTAKILSSEDLKNEAVRTLPQAFLTTPGVLVQQTTPGHGSPFIRGFTGRQNLILQDGIRLNNSTWRSGPVQYWNTVDSLGIDRLELVKSQGSVLYGSDAIGGTVNTITKGSGFRDEEGSFYHGSLSYRFDTNSESHLGRVEQRVGEGSKWGILLGASVKEFGDIRDSAIGTMRGTGYSERSYDFKFEYALSDSATLTLAHYDVDQDDILRWHRTTRNPGWTHGRFQAAPGREISHLFWQDRSLSYATIEDIDSPISWIDRWRATFSYQQTDDRNIRVRNETRTESRALETDTYGLNLEAVSSVGSGSFLWGADYYRDEVDSEGFRTDRPNAVINPIADNTSYDSLGLFLQWSHEIGDHFDYSLGARYTHISAKGPGFSISEDDIVFSGRARLSLTDSWSLFGGVSQSFRAPNLDDLTGNAVALNGLQTRGSLDLESEKYLTTELGIRHQTDTLDFSLSGYYTDGDNPIIRVRDQAGDLQTLNGDRSYLYGFETSLRWQIQDDWEFTFAAAWQDGQQRRPRVLGDPVEDDPIHRLHPLQGTVSLKWTHPSERYWISGRLTGADVQDRLSFLGENDTQRIPPQGTPGFLTASLYAGWQARDDLDLTLALENLTDEDYRIHGSGQNQPGFNATVGVTWRW